jgi:DNA-binding MarR family transcriptional regulator
VEANDLPETKHPYLPADRTSRIAGILDSIDDLVQHMSDGHTDAFLEIGITMPQAKMLYLVAADGGVRMSVLASRLGVTLSTVSGLVDRLVDGGLVDRHDDPADRRQVVVAVTAEGARLLERFRELNRRQMGDLLGTLADRDLATVSQAIGILARASARVPHPPEGDHP